MESLDPTAIAIRNTLDVQRAIQNTLLTANAARPKNTRKTTSRSSDGSIVTEGKLTLWLEEVVEARGNRTGATGMAGKLSIEGMRGYVKAVVALWKTQATLDPSLAGRHPRGKAIKDLLNTRQRLVHEHKRTTFHDRGAGTVQDTYTEDDMRRMSKFVFGLFTPRGIRDRLDFLLGHALVARSETTRFIQLADLFSMELTDEGPTPCTIVMVVMRQGKTNQHGRPEYGGCMRHKDVEVCPVGALAPHLFYRFEVLGEPFPDLSANELWHPTYLINGASATKEVSYSMQAGNMKKAMTACGIVTSKVTHSKRSSSTVIAEKNGATEAQIRRLGRWNAENMEGCYLTTLPKGAMRALAGFNSQGGGFSLKRAVTPVPEALTARVFAGVLQWATSDRQVTDIAAEGFLKLMLYLRNVVLQDAAVLRAQYPTHPLWNHPLFRSGDFDQYADMVLRVCASPEEHVVDSVRRAMPVLTNVMQSSFGFLGDRMSQLERGVERIDGRLAVLMEKGFKVVLNDDVPPQVGASTTVGEATSASAGPPALYSLSRRLQTVVEVWQEYTIGINGGPAVQDLEATSGTSWRQEESERRYFSRRKVFYTAVHAIADELSIPHREVAQALEAERKKLNKSLDGMMKHLKTRGALSVYNSHTGRD